MKIGIIGAGFTGLAAGFALSKKGHEVTIFESNNIPGGLAIGFKEKGWKWSLEAHYHHLFKTDKQIQKLANGVNHRIIFVRPKTSTFINNEICQIDSPANLLKFRYLNIFDRVRTGLFLAYLKLTVSWKDFEKVTTRKFLINGMGKKSWEVLWQPLMKKKFGKYASQIPASWFWARIKSRTAVLGYPEGGFKKFALNISREIVRNNGNILFNSLVKEIKKVKNKIVIKTQDNKNYEFDKVICTLPTYLYMQITKGLPNKYITSLKQLEGIGATNLILILNNKFLEDNTYWLNINDEKFPFLCVVEHTNFMNNKNYSRKNIIYIGNYLEQNHKYFGFSENELLNEYLPYLKKINKNFKKSWIKKMKLSKAFYAQPIIPKNYSKKIPSIKTPIQGLYLANIQQVYPWDRGTNYAVDLGFKVAKILIDDKNI